MDRHGAILKGMVHPVIHELKIAGERLVNQLLAESLICKNANTRVKGFTPSKWEYGKVPRDHSSIASEELERGLQSERKSVNQQAKRT